MYICLTENETLKIEIMKNLHVDIPGGLESNDIDQKKFEEIKEDLRLSLNSFINLGLLPRKGESVYSLILGEYLTVKDVRYSLLNGIADIDIDLEEIN